MRFSAGVFKSSELLLSSRRRAGSLPFRAEIQMKDDNYISTVARALRKRQILQVGKTVANS